MTRSPRGARSSTRAAVGCGAAAALVFPALLTGIGTASAAPAPDADATTITAAGDFSQRVPDGVCAVNVTIEGGFGGNAAMAGDPDFDPDDPDGDDGGGEGTPGAGAVLTARLDVQAGTLLEGTVGSNGANSGAAGPHGGGGAGGPGTHGGGAGGGYSELTIGGQVLLLAGGGGGTGGGHTVEFGGGGNAGSELADGAAVAGGTVVAGENGAAGQDRGVGGAPHQPGGGTAGTAVAGGTGGASFSGTEAHDGKPGSSLQGGQGGGPDGADQGGGGGGGFFGGGGGASTNGDVSFAHDGDTYYIVGGGGGGGSTFVSNNALLSDLGLGLNLDEDDAPTSSFAEFEWVMCEYDLSVTKSVVGPAVFEDGDTVTYAVTVTNNGADPMVVGDTVTIEDDLMEGGVLTDVTGALSESDVEIGDDIPSNQLSVFETVDLGDDVDGQRGLGAGESVTIEYSVVLTGTEPVTNSVETFERGGDPTNNVASAVVAPADPSLSLVKSANTDTVTRVGQEITYSFLVTNTGNISLRDVAIAEQSFSGAGTLPTPTCPDEPVAPGDSVTCTSIYTATAGDLTGQKLTNTATASALTPGGAPVLSAVSSAALTTVVPVAGLPLTGSQVGLAGLVLGLGMLAAGSMMMKRRRQAA